MSIDLLEMAEVLVQRPDAGTAGVWPRAAALLIRQALETALDDVWARTAPGVADASARAQLLCLAEYLGDRALAGEVSVAWAALSRACHHQAYSLPPTAVELGQWIAVVRRFVGTAGKQSSL
jgi:hypothetical protein